MVKLSDDNNPEMRYAQMNFITKAEDFTMKKLKVTKGAKCMACLECVRACSESFYKEFDPGQVLYSDY